MIGSKSLIPPFSGRPPLPQRGGDWIIWMRHSGEEDLSVTWLDKSLYKKVKGKHNYATFGGSCLSPDLRKCGKAGSKKRRTNITSQSPMYRQYREPIRLFRATDDCGVTSLFRRSKPWNGDIFISPQVWNRFLTCKALTIAMALYKKQKCIDLLIELTLWRKTLHLHFKEKLTSFLRPWFHRRHATVNWQ